MTLGVFNNAKDILYNNYDIIVCVPDWVIQT